MIRRLLCLLGFHKWERQNNILELPAADAWWKAEYGKIVYFIWDSNKFICKHCGRLKDDEK